MCAKTGPRVNSFVIKIGCNKYFTYSIIKTHNSESQGQEEAGRNGMRQTSKLFTGSTSEICKRSR